MSKTSTPYVNFFREITICDNGAELADLQERVSVSEDLGDKEKIELLEILTSVAQRLGKKE